MEESKNHRPVWLVSFTVGEDGSLLEYFIEEKDLADYRRDIADKLIEKLGKGLFDSKQEAEEWANAQMTEPSCECGCKTGGCCRKTNIKNEHNN